jgi:prepilin-type N-terminal cleavage/methylation domain-containing protein
MKIQQADCKRHCEAGVSGFTLVETLVAVSIGATMLAAFYATLASGFSMVGVTREDLRATQILLKRMETIRLCTFGEVANIAYNPATFTDYYDPTDASTGSGGVLYHGAYTAVTPPPGSVPDSYRTNMLLVTVDVTWNTGNIPHERSMQTYVARDGIQRYVSLGR